MNYTVYMHICPNGKKYVGITGQTISKRWRNGRGYKDNTHFYRVIQKYGWENIEHKIMANWCTKEYAQLWEQRLIESYRTMDSSYGYNKTSGGEKLKKMSEESKRKISKRNSQWTPTDETRERMSLAQRKRFMKEMSLGAEPFWQKNRDYSMNGIRVAHNKKRVIQYTLNGKYVATHNSIQEATNSLTNSKSTSNIGGFLAGKQKHAYGYIWKYADEEQS
jgi:hypothetical protein